jgi:hypothetical protein
MVMDPVRTETKNACTGEGQQVNIRPVQTRLEQSHNSVIILRRSMVMDSRRPETKNNHAGQHCRK